MLILSSVCLYASYHFFMYVLTQAWNHFIVLSNLLGFILDILPNRLFRWEACIVELKTILTKKKLPAVLCLIYRHSNYNLCLVNFHRELDFDGANQSLRIIKNLIEAGSYHSCAAIDEIISMFLEFTNLIIRTKLSAAYSLAVKVFT